MRKQEKKSLGDLVSDLLTEALAHRSRRRAAPQEFSWISRPMGARVDISRKDALYAALDERAE